MVTVRKLQAGNPIAVARSLHGIYRGLPAVEVSDQCDMLRVWRLAEEINLM